MIRCILILLMLALAPVHAAGSASIEVRHATMGSGQSDIAACCDESTHQVVSCQIQAPLPDGSIPDRPTAPLFGDIVPQTQTWPEEEGPPRHLRPPIMA